ncbi:MAG: hypothetical protein RBU45_17090 [Myxococcota bacterium]|jgi:hypothetical protein|nr:hypothetical protein [Myxococcota bacterium]
MKNETRLPSLLWIVVASCGLLLAACAGDAKPQGGGEGEGEGEGAIPDCPLRECDLFISEVLPNPEGTDGPAEYIELFNPLETDVDLRGCVLELVPGTDNPKTHTVLSNDPVVVPSRGFLLLGPENAAGVDYRWKTLGELPNSSSKGPHQFRVKADETTVVTSFTYLAEAGSGEGQTTPTQGASFQLNARSDKFTCPGAADPGNWCLARAQSGDNLGTPGASNTLCHEVPTCSLTACDLFFSEVLADPEGADADKEFIELYNPTDATLVLNGCTLELTVGTNKPKTHLIDSEEEVVVLPGEFFLLGPDSAEGVDYQYQGLGLLPSSSATGAVTLKLLSNRGGSLQEVDSFTYLDGSGGPLDKPTEGVSFQLGQDADEEGDSWFSCAGNDLPTHWCPGVRQSANALATPNRMNDFCLKVFCTPVDAAGANLPEREALPPAPGELYISEVYPDPGCTTEKDYEWFELVNDTDRELDLIGLGIYVKATDEAPKYSFLDTDRHCFNLGAGQRVVIAANANPELNGGIPADFSYLGKVTLRNDNGYLALRLPDRVTVIDEAAWEDSTANHSLELSPSVLCSSAAANSDGHCWHSSPVPQAEVCGAQTYHTAGEANEQENACYCQEGGGWFRIPDRLDPDASWLEVTEILANAPGSESDFWAMEWVEVHTLAAGYLNCGGLDTGTTRRDFPWQSCWSVPAGRHVLLAASGDPLANGGLPAANLREMGRMNLPGQGDLFLRANGRLQDQVLGYPTASDGHAVRKDSAGRFCEADEAFGDSVFFGTPGEANSIQTCPSGNPNEIRCLDTGSGLLRPAIAPAPCQVIFSEVLNNPEGADGMAEWIELYVVEGAPFDLNALRLQVGEAGVPRALVREECLTVTPGDRLLLVRDLAAPVEEGAPRGDAQFNESLVNTNLVLRLLQPDATTLVDEVRLASDPGSGRSHSLTEDSLTCLLNDEAARWCANAPTPRAVNPECSAGEGEGEGEGEPVPAGFCLPPEGGVARAVVEPPVGGVIVSEIFSNPEGTEGPKEWLELYTTADGPVDLNGLHLKLQANDPAPLQGAHCVTVSKGDYVLLAKSADPATNGGLPAPGMLFTGTLVNSDLSLQLLALDGSTVLDAVTYGKAVEQEKSVQLSLGKLDATANDLEASWCQSVERGTPGAANVECSLP